MIDKNEIKSIIRDCWEIACTVELPGMKGEMFIKDANGQPGFDSTRWQLFWKLVERFVPTRTTSEADITGSFEQREPKEGWQE